MWLVIYIGDPPIRISVDLSQLNWLQTLLYFGRAIEDITFHDLLRYCFVRSYGLERAEQVFFAVPTGMDLRSVDFDTALRFYTEPTTIYLYRRATTPANLRPSAPLRANLLDRAWDLVYQIESRYPAVPVWMLTSVPLIVCFGVMVLFWGFGNAPGHIVAGCSDSLNLCAPIVTTRLPSPTAVIPQATWTPDQLAAAQDTVRQFFELRTKAYKDPHQAHPSTVLIGEPLRRQESVLKTLADGNCYWIFSNQDVEFVQSEIMDMDHIQIEVKVQENADAYCNGQLHANSYTRDRPYSIRFNLEREGKSWYITQIVIVGN